MVLSYAPPPPISPTTVSSLLLFPWILVDRSFTALTELKRLSCRTQNTQCLH
jgi:hypothetical protein